MLGKYAHMVRPATIGMLAGVNLMLAGCAGQIAGPAESSLPAPPTSAVTSTGSSPAGELAPLAAAYKANPSNPAAAIAYAHALRASGAKAEALAIVEKAAIAQPSNRNLQVQRALIALDLGEIAKAEKLLRRADNGQEWRVQSALGVALSLSGKQHEAQTQFAKALAIAPDNPTVLNNLALSYVLDGKADEAENLLRKVSSATGTAPLQQNLALVLGLRGKYDEARSLGKATLSPASVGENIAYLQSLSPTRSAPSPAKSADVTSAKRDASVSIQQPMYQLGGPSPQQLLPPQ